MAKDKSKIASVLAFEKKLVPSDGIMSGTTWENRSGKSTLLKLREKSVRGTISNRLKAAISNDPLKLNAEVDKPNLQTVDSCSLSHEQDTLKLEFSLKILSGVQNPSACNNNLFKESYTSATEKYIEEYKFTELATRYALNIANGRFLWRNRVGCENIEIVVSSIEKQWKFDSKKLSIRNFDNIPEDVKDLSTSIAKALSGEEEYLLLEIVAYAQIGKGQDVYPSEELVLDKGNSKSKKSKILYHVDETAAMHSQKIGNALRTIDTWYPEFENVSTGSIAIEPYGAVTNLGVAYRTPKDKSDFFTLFDKFALGEDLENENDKHYVMGILVRGGVFGESGKE